MHGAALEGKMKKRKKEKAEKCMRHNEKTTTIIRKITISRSKTTKMRKTEGKLAKGEEVRT